MVSQFGIVAQQESHPTALNNENHSWYTTGLKSGAQYLGAEIDNIISENNADNNASGEVQIYGAPYVYLSGEYGTDAEDPIISSAEYSMSLKDCCDAIDAMIATMLDDKEDAPLGKEYQEWMTNLFTGLWKDMGLDWTFETFPKAAE